ncbi:unannotated protein [freshwater metagenome]|uniref:Unannotated protein n=1 Tax=freshwater metagenome TaxID=449393 RepID=A0A6J6LWW5_9ZZZZ
MTKFWLTFAVVAGNLGNDFNFIIGKPEQICMPDDVVGVEMMFGMRHGDAHIGQEGCGLQIKTIVEI